MKKVIAWIFLLIFTPLLWAADFNGGTGIFSLIKLGDNGATAPATLNETWFNDVPQLDEVETVVGTWTFTTPLKISGNPGQLVNAAGTSGFNIPNDSTAPSSTVNAFKISAAAGVNGFLYYNLTTSYLKWVNASTRFDLSHGLNLAAGSLLVGGVILSDASRNVTGGSGTFTNITDIGNTVIGASNANTVTFNSDVVSHVLPDLQRTYNLGEANKRWNNVYLDTINLISTGLTPATFESTDAGAAPAVAKFYRNSVTPASADEIFRLLFSAQSLAASEKNFAAIDVVMTDATGASEDGTINIYTAIGGTLTKVAVLGDSSQHLSAGLAPLLVSSTEAGAAPAVLDLYRDSPSPAIGDIMVSIYFNGEDSAGNKELYGGIIPVIFDPVSGSEDAAIYMYATTAGVLTEAFRIFGRGIDCRGDFFVQLDSNADGTNSFIIEDNAGTDRWLANENGSVVQTGNLSLTGTAPQVSATGATAAGLLVQSITDIFLRPDSNANGSNFVIFESDSGTDVVAINEAGDINNITGAYQTNGTARIAATGNGTFADGSNSIPSHSFSSDTATGAYLAGTSIYAIATNGNQRIKIENTKVTIVPAAVQQATHHIHYVLPVKTGLVDNAATNIFSITTTNETGSNDGGAWHVEISAIVSHNVSATNTSFAIRKHTCWIKRGMLGAGTGGNSGVTATDVDGADLIDGSAVSTITAITVAIAESTEYVNNISYQVDLSGSGVTTGEVQVVIDLYYHGFTTAPTIAAL